MTDSPLEALASLRRKYIEDTPKAVALYHVVFSHEDFETAAQHLFVVLRLAVESHPGKRRVLYLDIDKHRDGAGKFDHDMYELQDHFIPQILFPHLSEVFTPLGHFIRAEGEQSDELPPGLEIRPA